jgi:hypothetical protein
MRDTILPPLKLNTFSQTFRIPLDRKLEELNAKALLKEIYDDKWCICKRET